MEKDFYQILNIPRNSSPQDICLSYKKLALKYHPERSKDSKTENYIRFAKVSEAYEVLSNKTSKDNYDGLGYSKFINGYSTPEG